LCWARSRTTTICGISWYTSARRLALRIRALFPAAIAQHQFPILIQLDCLHPERQFVGEVDTVSNRERWSAFSVVPVQPTCSNVSKGNSATTIQIQEKRIVVIEHPTFRLRRLSKASLRRRRRGGRRQSTPIFLLLITALGVLNLAAAAFPGYLKRHLPTHQTLGGT